MKILFLSHQAEFMYGGEICTLEIMHALKKDGHEIYFASPRGPYQEIVQKNFHSILVPSVDVKRKILQLFRLLPAIYKTNKILYKTVSASNISIIHASSLKSFVYALLIARKKLVPVIWHHHDIMQNSWSNRLWLRFLASFANGILVPSLTTKRALVDCGVDQEQINVLYNGFPIDRWNQRLPRIQEEKNKFQVYMIGEISHRKGSDLIYPVLESLRKRNRDDFIFTIVGEGLSNLSFSQSIKKKNQQAVDDGRLVFLGRRNDVATLLQKADILFVPSRQDPLPTVIIEAGLSGVPVLGSEAGGIPEMIQDGENGFLCDSVEQYVEKLIQLKDQSDLWNRMSASARHLATERYSIDALVKKLNKFYQKLV